MRALPIIIPPHFLRILVIKLALNAEVLPHLDEVERVIRSVPHIAQLILDLQHDDRAAVCKEEGLYYWRKG